MPKVIKTYDFDGGLNSESDARDLKGQVAGAYNVMFDTPGRIRSMGQLEAVPAYTGTSLVLHTAAFKTVAGYGLLSIGVDYPMTTSTPVYSPRNTVIIAHAPSSGNQQVGFLDSSGADVYAFATLGTTPSAKVVYYYVDGALRACDANFGANNSFAWYGHIHRTDYDNVILTGSSTKFERVLHEWHADTWLVGGGLGLAPPTAGLVSISSFAGDAGSSATLIVDADLQRYASLGTPKLFVALTSGLTPNYACHIVSQAASPSTNLNTDNLGTTWDGKSFYISPPAGNGFTLALASPVTSGTWTADALEFASSYVYEGDQESPLFAMNGTFTPTVNKALTIVVSITKEYTERVKGGRIYYRNSGSSDKWKLLADVDLGRGIRKDLTDQFSPDAGTVNATGAWVAPIYTGAAGASSNIYAYASIVAIDPSLVTHESINGFSQDVSTLAIHAKWFALGNTRAWAGNIRTTNAAGTAMYYGDRIMYTPPGKYDTWPPSNYIDIGIDDGDAYTAGQVYADRLLAFKDNKLYIINVAQGADTAWYLESEHYGCGVKFPAATFKCDLGILWVNRNGCYWYDGEQIRNLLEGVVDGKMERVISRSAWTTFVSDTAIIGYDPQRRQIVVLGNANTNTGLVYVFDIATRTWSAGDRFAAPSNAKYTNFAIYDNQLILGEYTA
jgi:hypothetical protein